MFKKSIVLLTVTLLSLNSEAQNVSTSESNAGYEIFKDDDGKGFVIVCNGAVIGYSTEQPTDDMPDALKEMLRGCGDKVASTRGDFPEWFTPRDVEAIQPLITSHWSQYPPYNDSLPKKTGICVTIAHAQVAHYYRPSRTYLGLKDIPETTFNHDLMLDKYDHASSTESRQEVARFVKYCKRVFDGGLDSKRIFGMKHDSYGKYTIGANTFKRAVNSTYEFLDSCLESKTPVIAYGCDDFDNGHCFIIDGRDSEGLYHINWGWGGSYDGYFAIADAFDDVRTSAKYTVSSFVLLGYVDGTTTIIPVRQNTRESGSIFNLQGRKVAKSLEGLSKGIYIKDGKLYVIK